MFKKYELQNTNYTLVKAICLAAVALLVFILPSCKTENDTYVADFAYEYYPTDSGHYVVYQVDSITYDENAGNDTARYQLMEVITDTFYDNENVLNYRLELFRRANSNAGWALDRVWFLKKNTTTLQKIEDDLRFIKLVFPPAEGKTWNGNLYIPVTEPFKDFEDWEYTYSNTNQPYTVGALSFDSSLTVKQVDEEDLINKKFRTEVYAKNVGMVYQEWAIMAKQDIQANWETGAESGFKMYMRLIDHN